MGLGKTLQMISLVAAGKELQQKCQPQATKAERYLNRLSSVEKATLIVAPVNGKAWLYTLLRVPS